MARTWLLPALVVGMETGWLTIWATLFGVWLGLPPGHALLPAPTIAALIGSGWLLARTAWRRGWPVGQARGVVAAGGILGALLAVRAGPLASYGPVDPGWIATLVRALPATFHRPDPAVVALPFALYLWWRGLRRARHPLYADDVEGALRWGFVGIAVGLVLRTAVAPLAGSDVMAAAVTTFLFAGLTAVALVQVESMQGESRARENIALLVNRHWFGFLIALVGAMLMVAIVLAQMVSFDLLDALARAVLPTIQLIALVALFVVALPIGLLLEGLIWIIRRLRGDDTPAGLPKINVDAFNQFRQFRDQAERAVLSPEAIAVIKWVLLGLVAAAILAALVRSMSRLNDWGAEDAIEEERDFVWSWPGVRALLHRWLARRIRRRQPVFRTADPSHEDEASPPETLSLRAMYRELLRLGAALGWPRHPGQTPHEYAGRLRGQPGLAADALDILTEAYVQARYGPEPPDQAVAIQARAALDRLRSAAGSGQGDPPSRR
ncbi:MAG: DUF4129 domain-containing protein [Chloroflexi bacterium]|nr:DUF4129 domain-containing protein [Chloroflexota bacterium]